MAWLLLGRFLKRTAPLILVSVCGLLWLLPPSFAQSPVDPPSNSLRPTIQQIAAKIAASATTAKSASATNATRVSLGTNSLYLPTLAKALGSDEAEQKSLNELLEGVLKAYIENSGKPRSDQDVTDAVAFFLMVQWTVHNDGKEAPDAGLDKMTEQLRAALDTPAMQKASNSEKQALFEYCVGMGGFTLAMYSAAKEGGSENAVQSLRSLAGKLLTVFLEVEPKQVTITNNGLRISGQIAKVAPSPPASVSTAKVTYKDPAGWQKEVKDGLTIFVAPPLPKGTNDTDRHDIRILMFPPIPAKETPDVESEKLFQDIVKSYQDEKTQAVLEYRSWNFRYTLENGRACYAIVGRLQPKNDDVVIWFTAYLLDFGNTYVPILRVHARFNEDPAVSFRSLYNRSPGRKDDRGEYTVAIEDFVRTVSVAGATPSRPLFNKSLFVGSWSSTTQAFNSTDYYSATTGAYVGNVTNALSSGEVWTLRSDGSAEYSLAMFFNGKVQTEKVVGKWILAQNSLLIKGKLTQNGVFMKEDERGDLIIFYGKDPKTQKPFFLTSGLLRSDKPLHALTLSQNMRTFIPSEKKKD